LDLETYDYLVKAFGALHLCEPRSDAFEIRYVAVSSRCDVVASRRYAVVAWIHWRAVDARGCAFARVGGFFPVHGFCDGQARDYVCAFGFWSAFDFWNAYGSQSTDVFYHAIVIAPLPGPFFPSLFHPPSKLLMAACQPRSSSFPPILTAQPALRCDKVLNGFYFSYYASFCRC
jgi:hypothetical protein